MTEAFGQFVNKHEEGERYANIHQDEALDQAHFWLGAFVREVERRAAGGHYGITDRGVGVALQQVVRDFGLESKP